MTKFIKPFEVAKEFMRIHNSLFDFVMPSLSPNAWKVYCFILRKTWGYCKDTDAVSYTQITRGCNIKSFSTVSKSLTELSVKRLIKSVTSDGQTTSYSLNEDIEINTDHYKKCSGSTTESVAPTTTESVDTKDKEKRQKTLCAETAQLPSRNPDPFFDKLADITQTSPKLQGAMIGKTKSKLLKDEATLQDLDCFKAYWYSQDWRGKKGEVPSLPQVVSEWTKAKTWQGNFQSAGPSTNNGEWEWATIPTGIVLRHKGGTFPSLRGEEAKQKAREVGLEVIF